MKVYGDDIFTCGGVFKIFQKRNGILYNCSEKEKIVLKFKLLKCKTRFGCLTGE